MVKHVCSIIIMLKATDKTVQQLLLVRYSGAILLVSKSWVLLSVPVTTITTNDVSE